jgi:hypothetical protein
MQVAYSVQEFSLKFGDHGLLHFHSLIFSKGISKCTAIGIFSLFGWLVADGWCWFVLREEYCWLVAAGCWWLVRSERKVLLAGG